MGEAVDARGRERTTAMANEELLKSLIQYNRITSYVLYANVAVALGTLILAVFTACMARQTAQVAKATEEASRAANEELAFMKAEASERDSARLEIDILSASYKGVIRRDDQATAFVQYRVFNFGPQWARALNCRGWWAVHSDMMNPQHAHDEMEHLGAGADPQDLMLTFNLGSPRGQDEKEMWTPKPADFWLLVTWVDGRGRPWAQVLWITYDVDPSSRVFTPKGPVRYWPPKDDLDKLLTPDDPLVNPTVEPAQLLAEVRRRLSG